MVLQQINGPSVVFSSPSSQEGLLLKAQRCGVLLSVLVAFNILYRLGYLRRPKI